MGQALRKVTGWRGPSSVLKGTIPEAQKPMESRFQDPRLQGHLPGDVHPDPPHPFAGPGDEAREWDKSDPMYSAMVKQLAGNVVTKQGPKGVDKEAFFRRPLPKNRHNMGVGPDENTIVAPGTLNVGHIRQIFLSYQGLAGEKPMDAKALAEKYNVDVVLLEKVLQYYAIPEKKGEFKTVIQDSPPAPKLE